MKPINTANKCMQNCFCEILAHTRNVRNYSVQTTSTSSFLSKAVNWTEAKGKGITYCI